ncbi:MAG TPA: glutamine--fructose-6-phosphate transaminase (isomerizing) [Elusimicrobia bacterium]|nr:MAG: glutamine--fructose-6-phosphate aminotransferase [Elusimicrobia bacterium RIFOXYA12_FULL_49_49]OGS09144.1 MAG: glutamine--fructose-6-phosphate aminotransferase [Elusimicrobia bacterium RIFOXYA1_FULL_47_7]OGS14766.1 MAG: glutamine--fructose-6-phosphate aminotransferase [Elusimicrobia bacterium RIFOXYA2_FULL_47_53]OGS25583.1 MAG: glutamine--fructose-6-phosphate aminotransferase [Elusimicrobia bacterium RIFOXYB12_FULL_50_12]OGS28950.1 MAG: glutamine--fructose-6-phosphate aminotransferase [
MCGIVGYIGSKNAGDVIIDGLSRLEYRGYDSAGIAVISEGKIDIRRSVGKLKQLVYQLSKNELKGATGIGHTRWATHGKPSEENAHPHTDCSGKIVVVHNGIIENYLELKKRLVSEGHKFKSETDTEVLAHLVEESYKGDIFKAVVAALSQVRGTYALGVICSDNPGEIIAARQDAPLIAGIGDNENFIASDIPALLPYTRKMIFLEEGDIIRLSASKIEVLNRKGEEQKRKIQNIAWDAVQAEKGGFKHFMLKEIFEQPQTIQDTFRGRMNPETGKIELGELNIPVEAVNNLSKINIVACGTSYHAGLVGKFLFENLAKIPVEVDIASEFRYREPIIDKNAITIIISQSGETADTLAALKLVKSGNCRTLAICNVMGSTASREADDTLYTRCGPEIGVASTKAFTGQLTALYLLAIDWASKRKAISKEKAEAVIKELWEIPGRLNEVLKASEDIHALAKEFSGKRDFLFLGRNVNYPIALEGALKLKEISYIHAEGYPAGEMKHGPIALIDENMPVMVIATESKVYEKILGNIEEAKARGGTVLAIASEGDTQIKAKTTRQIFVPRVDEIFSPILNVVPTQLFSYYVAVVLGCDVDQPRNLAKSVTVE